ncbi:hypothetical protein JOB18_014793 [Solea senegalensis]|uniref:Uncharacterized protein n=1 Tax=Solea senegalensis TaxID=28829 RepID=A0AAV6RSV3_SOLSE|nr:hypothetical protein JOB18_014793 [Solea senegalensis]
MVVYDLFFQQRPTGGHSGVPGLKDTLKCGVVSRTDESLSHGSSYSGQNEAFKRRRELDQSGPEQSAAIDFALEQ